MTENSQDHSFTRARDYIFNVFNSKGIYIADIVLDAYVERFTGNFPLYARARNGRLYVLREKDSGYKELCVYRMIWLDRP